MTAKKGPTGGQVLAWGAWTPNSATLSGDADSVWGQTARVQISVLPFPGWVTLGKLLCLSVPQFPHSKGGLIITTLTIAGASHEYTQSV